MSRLQVQCRRLNPLRILSAVASSKDDVLGEGVGMRVVRREEYFVMIRMFGKPKKSLSRRGSLHLRPTTKTISAFMQNPVGHTQ